MPALSNPTLWRTHPHTTEGYLVVYVPSVIFACNVNQATFSYPILQVTYDGVTTGAYTDVIVGQTVKIYSSAGVFKGYGRVRLAPTSSILYVGALPQGDVNFANNDLVEVLDEHRPSNKISINADEPSIPLTYKDYYETFSDQTLKPPPKCNLGPHFADFVDGDGYIYVSFDLTASCYAVADGATITTYAANLAGGTVTSGSVASGIFTVRYGAGTRHLVVTITDSNSKTHTAKLLIVGCEKTGANAPLRCKVSNLGYQTQGWGAEFEILADDAGPTVIPNQAMVIYFEKENYGGTAGSLNGFAGREHIKFVGWVDTGSNEIEPLLSDLTIRCIGPRERLNREASFGGQLTNAAAPANWQEMANLDLFKFIHYILHWHTTILDVCDLEKPDWAALTPYWTIGVPEGLMADTVNELAKNFSALFTCDRQGRFFLRHDWMMLDDTDRGGVTTTVALQAHDWEKISLEERNINQAFAVSASGVVASRTVVTPLRSVAPGKTSGQGGTNEQLNNQLVTGQDELNMRAGRLYGRRNSKWGNLTIRVWPGGMVADPAWGERIQLTLDETTNKRGVSFSSEYFLLHEMRVQHDHVAGTTSEEWVQEPETFGYPGETLPVRVEAINDIGWVGLPEYPPWEDIEYDPRPTAGIEFAASPAAYMCHANYLTRTRNHVDASPNWEIVFSAADVNTFLGVTGIQLTGFVLDPWNPKYGAYLNVFTPGGGGGGDNFTWLIYIQNLDGAPGSQILTVLKKSESDVSANNIVRAGINVDGSLWSWYWLADATNWHHIFVRTSKTAAVTDLLLDRTFHQSIPVRCSVGHHMAGGGTGKVYVLGLADPFWGGVAPGSVLLRSLVMGTNFTTRSPEYWRSSTYDADALGSSNPTGLHLPYSDNANDDVFYMSFAFNGVQCLIRHNADGSWSNVGPNISGTYYYPIAWYDNIHTYTNDRQYMFLTGQNGATQKVFTSTDAGDAWTDRNAPAGEIALLLGSWGWPTDQNVMVMSVGTTLGVGANRGIWWTQDLFSATQYAITWNNALGDWETVTGETYTNPVNYVAVWVP